MNRAEAAFGRLQCKESVLGLVGQTEEPFLDCKEWPSNDPDAQKKMLAKAACGLANGEGGVLVIGMRAKPVPKDSPDLIESPQPVSDTAAVRSRVLDLIGQLVEPGIEGVDAIEIPESDKSKSGFVVVYIPAADGPPRRSRKDSKFYLRIGTGTFPMEYYQIEERFGRSPRPKLELHLEPDGFHPAASNPVVQHRWFVLGLRNIGRGIAKFPSVRFNRKSGLHVDNFGLDGNYNFGIPLRSTEPDWFTFRGGIDDVIYPNETRLIAKLRQAGQPEYSPKNVITGSVVWRYDAARFSCDISAEGIPTITVVREIEKNSVT